MPAPVHFAESVSESFWVGQSYYGDTDSSVDVFTDYVWSIACKHRDGPVDEPAVIAFARRLYLRDLYLACACVHKSEKAWAILDRRYRKSITDLVRFCYR